MRMLVCSINEEEKYDGRGKNATGRGCKIQKILHDFCPNSMAVAAAPLKDRVFKIGILNIGSSAPAAEICAGQHNRLLRRQHCSSLCSQSEGHEHVANMTNALRHDFVRFLAVFGRHNIRPPHFASKVSYSASPQTFAECLRSAFCCYAAMLFGSKPRRVFLDLEPPTRQNAHLSSAQNAAQRKVAPFLYLEEPPKGGRTIAKLSFEARREA